MDIKKEAREFAIMAHNKMIRKSEPDKPMVIHPINVANILESYGFDEEVIAAGYLHDVVEDTKYTLKDIEEKFGSVVASLVDTASEPDKSLSWEERKEHTINSIKEIDLNHKAIVCADKISNLEDMTTLFGKLGNKDFSSFRRGYDKQKWYYENVYQSLIYNEDENHPMFVRLKNIIDNLFNDRNDNSFIKNTIFNGKKEEYEDLKKINYKVKEINKMISVMDKKYPYVIEFTGTPRTGKTTLINNLNDLFKKGGCSVDVLEEFTTSKKYKTEIKPLLKEHYKKIVNFEIPKYVYKQLDDALNNNADIIIADRSLCDRIVWVDRLYLKDGLTNEEYDDYKRKYVPLIKKNINMVVATYTDSTTAIKRDYNAYLSLEPRNFLNINNVSEYNTSLKNIEILCYEENINFNLFDTTLKNQRDISIDVANKILDDMREYYVNILHNIYNK